MAFIDRNLTQAWSNDPTFNPTGINRKLHSGNIGLKYVNSESVGDILNSYKQNKNYQYITTLFGNINTPISIKFSSPFNSSVASVTRVVSDSNSVDFYTYANPTVNEDSKSIIQYGATEAFTSSIITKSKLNEIDFLINGYREFKYNSLGFTHSSQPNGWSYDNGSYNWYYSTTSTISPTYSTFGSGQNTILPVNYIAKIIDYDVFNLDFNYTQNGGSTTNGLNLYLVEESKLKGGVGSWGTPFSTITSSSSLTQSYTNKKATNLDGSKNYATRCNF